MKHACAGLRAVIGCSFLCSLFCCLSPAAAAPKPPPVSPSPTTRYEYDAMGHVTKILRGTSGDSTSIAYDSVYRITSITDAKQGSIRFGYWGMTPYINKVTDPRGLETLYERTGLGHVMKIVSPDTGTTEFTYVPGTYLVQTALDSRGVLTRYTYDAGSALTSVVRSQGGRTELPTQFRYDEQGPGFTYTIGRLSSTSHAGGGSRYSYAPLGDLLTDTQFLDAASGANTAPVMHTVRYGYASGGHVRSIVYPSGHKLHITLHRGDVTAMALAPNETAEPSPLISAVKWAPFGMGNDGWQWHRSGGPVPHERTFDLSGRMTRYPIGQVLRDVRYDAQDRIAAFTHQQPDGTLQPALDQQFGYDEVDRLTSVVTATTSWSIAYDPNSNRASVSLDGIPSRYDTEPTSNRLRGVTNPARNLAQDNAGNTTSDSAGYTATYDMTGQLATLSKGGVTTTYTYNAGRSGRTRAIRVQPAFPGAGGGWGERAVLQLKPVLQRRGRAVHAERFDRVVRGHQHLRVCRGESDALHGPDRRVLLHPGLGGRRCRGAVGSRAAAAAERWSHEVRRLDPGGDCRSGRGRRWRLGRRCIQAFGVWKELARSQSSMACGAGTLRARPVLAAGQGRAPLALSAK